MYFYKWENLSSLRLWSRLNITIPKYSRIFLSEIPELLFQTCMLFAIKLELTYSDSKRAFNVSDIFKEWV